MAKEEMTMDKIRRFLKRFRLVYRKSTPLTKAVVLSAIVLSLVALLTIRLAINATNDRISDLSGQAAGLEQNNQELQEDIDKLGTVDSVIEIAQKIWDLVFPDTVIIEPEE